MPAGAPKGPSEEADATPNRWDEPRDGQVEVLLVGSVHIAGYGGDDMLAPGRQRELRQLADRLEAWNPDGVAVEFPEEHQNAVNDVYKEYCSGERAYDEESAMGPFSPYGDDPQGECRTEPVQIGFRLADRCGHDGVYAVDYPLTLDKYLTNEESAAADWDALWNAESDLSVPVAGPTTEERLERWRTSTVTEFLRWLHREENLRKNERSHLAMALAGPDQQYVGAKLQTAWYDRNLRILENLWGTVVESDADRFALVIGEGHVHVLRQLLRDAPPLCPVNPQPVLAGE